jgi:hypothetical protein
LLVTWYLSMSLWTLFLCKIIVICFTTRSQSQKVFPFIFSAHADPVYFDGIQIWCGSSLFWRNPDLMRIQSILTESRSDADPVYFDLIQIRS